MAYSQLPTTQDEATEEPSEPAESHQGAFSDTKGIIPGIIWVSVILVASFGWWWNALIHMHVFFELSNGMDYAELCSKEPNLVRAFNAIILVSLAVGFMVVAVMMHLHFILSDRAVELVLTLTIKVPTLAIFFGVIAIQ